MQYKPHTFTIAAATLDEGSTTTGQLDYGTGTTVQGQITPMSQTSAFEDYGLELNRPHMVMVPIATSATLLQVNSKVVFGSREFIIKNPPQKWDAFANTAGINCFVSIMEEISA